MFLLYQKIEYLIYCFTGLYIYIYIYIHIFDDASTLLSNDIMQPKLLEVYTCYSVMLLMQILVHVH